MFLVQLEIGTPDLDGLTMERNLHRWLEMLENVNSKHGLALAASKSPEATDFLRLQFRDMNYALDLASYELPDSLRSPQSLCMRLRDLHTGRILYSVDLKEPLATTPAFFVFSASGSVSGNYVYAHHGMPQDFDRLRDSGVALKDRIVIISHSPLTSSYSLEAKVAYAEKFSCAAVLVYDGTEAHSISRAYRLLKPHLHMPVSSRQIKPVLETLHSVELFSLWRYGPTPADDSLQLEISLAHDDSSLKATNVFSRIEGVLNDAEVVIGASRDTLTSANPSSGQAVLLELMRRFQYLKLYGWKPLRSIRFAFWDASRSGALGSLASIHDEMMFKPNLPVLAYINLDQDVVTGSYLKVDANPLLNHVLRATAKSVPFPRNSKYFQNARETSAGSAEWADGLDDETSLWDLWALQDGGQINNKLGNTLGLDHGVFQLSRDTPVISVSYAPNPAFNESTYIAESNYYNLEWVSQHVDPQLELHALLVRFIGLLTLSLGEHEVVEYKATNYFRRVQMFFQDFTASNHPLLAAWAHHNVSQQSIGKALFTDIKARNASVEEITFGDVLNQTNILLEAVVEQAAVFDSYAKDVESLWTTDYPWFRMIRKIHVFAKFKFTNYKLLRLEKDLNQGLGHATGKWNLHFMYELPEGVMSIAEENRRAAFASLYEAAESRDMELLVQLMSGKYERLSQLYRRLK